MTILTKITFTCGGATNGKPCPHTFSQEGTDVTKHSTDVEARKAGWQWKGAKLQLCPEHRSNGNGKAKVSKSAAKPTAKASKKAAKKSVKPVMVAKARKSAAVRK